MFSPLSWHRTTQQNDNAGICQQSIEHANILLLLSNNNIIFRIHTAHAGPCIDLLECQFGHHNVHGDVWSSAHTAIMGLIGHYLSNALTVLDRL